MFGFNNNTTSGSDPSLVGGRERNLPRVLVNELSSRFLNATSCKEFHVEILLLDQQQSVANSALTYMGLRGQHLFWQGERAFAHLMNMIISNLGNQGIDINFITISLTCFRYLS